MDMQKLINDLVEFREKRSSVINGKEKDWPLLHNVKNLVDALNVEAGELQELFLWGKVPNISEVEEELADVFIFGLYIINSFQLDFEEVIRRKMWLNSKKYPVKAKSYPIKTQKNKNFGDIDF